MDPALDPSALAMPPFPPALLPLLFVAATGLGLWGALVPRWPANPLRAVPITALTGVLLVGFAGAGSLGIGVMGALSVLLGPALLLAGLWASPAAAGRRRALLLDLPLRHPVALLLGGPAVALVLSQASVALAETGRPPAQSAIAMLFWLGLALSPLLMAVRRAIALALMAGPPPPGRGERLRTGLLAGGALLLPITAQLAGRECLLLPSLAPTCLVAETGDPEALRVIAEAWEYGPLSGVSGYDTDTRRAAAYAARGVAAGDPLAAESLTRLCGLLYQAPASCDLAASPPPAATTEPPMPVAPVAAEPAPSPVPARAD